MVQESKLIKELRKSIGILGNFLTLCAKSFSSIIQSYSFFYIFLIYFLSLQIRFQKETRDLLRTLLTFLFIKLFIATVNFKDKFGIKLSLSFFPIQKLYSFCNTVCVPNLLTGGNMLQIASVLLQWQLWTVEHCPYVALPPIPPVSTLHPSVSTLLSPRRAASYICMCRLLLTSIYHKTNVKQRM